MNWIEIIETIQTTVYTIIGIISLVSLLTYFISRYYYRPYGKGSAKDILRAYKCFWILEGGHGACKSKKAIQHYTKARWKAYIAFMVEFNDEYYINNFDLDKDNPDKYHNKYVIKNGEMVKSIISHKIWKYVKTFLKRKASNVDDYYFYGEFLFPSDYIKKREFENFYCP